MNPITRALVATAAAGVMVVAAAGSASAHDCFNPNKKPGAGAQVVVNDNDEIVYASRGVENRIDRGIMSADGDGYHGLVGFDADGDGAADFDTYIVGKGAIVPAAEKQTGDPCHGITDFETYFTQCVN